MCEAVKSGEGRRWERVYVSDEFVSDCAIGKIQIGARFDTGVSARYSWS